MSKGSNAERKLCKELWQKGYAVLRAPGSGSIDRPSPDVVAANYQIEKTGMSRLRNQNIMAFEVKANPDGTANFSQREIDELESWAERCNAVPYVAIKPDLRKFDGWIIRTVRHLHSTNNGYSIRKQDHEYCVDLDML